MHRDSRFLENWASGLDMAATFQAIAEAFRPWRHVRMWSFTEPTIIILPDTPEFEELVARELVTDALQQASFGSVRNGIVLPVFPQKIPAVVFLVKKFRCKVIVKWKLLFHRLQMYSSPEGFVHGASVLDSRIRP